ncbi:hypothetical protein [Rheinheimera hassiensis]|uniref:hypothetical protein n=1 Tax=Rheinheimera hassiensis TaxID=1193627 RepID=UPI001F05D28A|nr:hypothetical protein [Rheinheimera hassiensis]
MKSREVKNDEIRPNFQQLVKSVNNTLRGLQIADADPALLLAYQKLLDHLNSCNPELLNQIFGSSFSAKREARRARISMSDSEIHKLSNEDLEKLLALEDSTKVQLAKIAEIRFSVTKGTISKLSKEALRLKLQNLIDNEKTHQAIGRVARSSS